jgi:hypothetical protein
VDGQEEAVTLVDALTRDPVSGQLCCVS